ncbi:transketolase [Halothiobacillus neapolitanus]|uniref:Transketolase n=1 Tax=Halothiobacillus neapolitanus (strain ATCC 23641 / DSM 15147 / CIP 104769 / NCIMB 8539 / c2) TaxID=555778 RepID=D0KXU3_HALNC|nr:transketolase [Halothiobacillus neapolitanus]ACX95266.1 transketolase [Halothiobacillus neapolitanus c2]TDN59371.1 transketolase [Halothiobacillus neapolitanus]
MSTRRELANAIRALSMDAVQKANSGHPGAPMGMADIAEVLWNGYLKHNPKNPQWPNRDRFVLSNGHGSMLIYSLLHLSGYELPMEELKNFRQLHSKTPGHPEYGYTPGVETTTGPLGQGITNAVGFAIAEKMLAGQFNKPGHNVVDHYTYCFLGDGCMMEGISHEACSLAGTLGLGKLIAFYDDNGISIDGHVEGWFTDDTPARFEAYGWHVVRDVDGHDAEAIDAAIREARSVNDKPTMICTKTVIGFGAPNLCGTHDCHGAALGEAEVKATRDNLGWHHEPFVIPAEIYAGWDATEAGIRNESAWEDAMNAYAKAYPAEAAELKRRLAGDLPADFTSKMDAFIAEVAAKGETIATRKASQNSITAIAAILPEIVGGSADLAPSNLTTWKGCRALTATESDANYIHYGVREFGMSAIMNGMVLHGGFVPFAATFLMFSEYARNALRMSALMKIGSIFVYTHDSIGLGEDGPTHQPVEQIATLRMIPRMNTWRPCDAVESAVAWKAAIMRRDSPSTLIFSRQNLAHQNRTPEQIANIARGGYILRDCAGTPDLILIATGSEVALATAAAEKLAGKKVRVVSMPCTEVFDAQDPAYRESVLPAAVRARVAVEAGVTGFWGKYVGLDGKVVGIDTFGESAPAGDLFKLFGFTVDNVVATAQSVL